MSDFQRVIDEHDATMGRQFIDQLHVVGAPKVHRAKEKMAQVLHYIKQEAPLKREHYEMLNSVEKTLHTFDPNDIHGGVVR